MPFTFKLSKRLAMSIAAIGGLLWGCTDSPSGTPSDPIVVDMPFAVGDTLFSDGFESGSISWDDNFLPQAKTVVAAAARSGTRGLRVTYASGGEGGNLSKFIAPGDRVYFRAAVRFPATWTGSTGLLTIRAATAADRWASFGKAGVCPTGTTWAATGAYTTVPNLDLVFNTYFVGMPSQGPAQCQPSAGSSASYTAPLAVPKGSWQVVEVEAQMNTVGQANGWQKTWLNGTLQGNWTGLTFRTSNAVQWNAVSLELPGRSITQSQTLDIDDVVVLRQQPAVAVSSVQVAPTSATVNAGATLALTATVRDAAGNVLTNRAVSWSSSSAAVASVNGSGVVSAVSAGSATITATSEGRSASTAVTVPAPVPAPAPATGQVLLSEGFDNTQFATRGWYDFVGTPAVTTADKHSGTGSLEFRWNAGSTTPPAKVMRKLFPATDRLYVSYWVKYSSNYVGSAKGYHPHEFSVLSNQDQDWDALTYNYLNTYIEQNYQNGGIPRIAIQDSRMIDVGRIGANLTGITENRSVGGCNGNPDGSATISCYQSTPTQWYNAKTWDGSAVAFRPTTGTDYKNNWNRVEVEFQLNTIVNGIGQSNGIVRYWLNGNLKIERTNVLFRTGANPGLKFRQFLLTPYIGDGSPVAQTMWVDDLLLATSRDGSVTPPPPSPAAVATVAVTPSAATVVVGATSTLTAATRDAAGTILTGRTITWTTSAAGVATVVNGVVTGRGAGQATVTATSEGRTGSATITVTAVAPAPVATVAVTPSAATVVVGATSTLTAVTRNAAGATLTGRSIAWTTSAAGVATVVNGVVTGRGAGQATITATSEGRTGSATITVTAVAPAPVATVAVTPSAATVVVGATSTLTAVTRNAAGATLTGRTITWTTSAAGVATVVNGVVTGRGAGQATITATSEGRTGSATITVTAVAPAPVATVAVTPATATISIGATSTLTAVTRNAAGATLTGRSIAWTTSAAGVATVVNGVVTGRGAGQATITATSEGRSGAATVTVTATTTPPPTTGSYPNEPVGAAALIDWDTDFSNIASGGWGYTSGTSNLSTVTDATAPVNPSKVGRVRFSAGCCNGTGPARLETYKVPPSGWQQWYVSDWVKFDTNYQPHACCQKLFEFFWSSGGDKWLIVKADPTNGAFPLMARLTTEFSGSATQNLGSQAVIRAGVWYQYEVIVNRSGRVQLWIREQGKSPVSMYDGTPPGTGTINPGFLFWWWGYGGLGAYAGSQPGYIYHNHFRVSWK